ncbi:MAG: hypothetical protein EPN82_13080 [Bacteroidetes bacterium]|nr:MAG: hypothetical protein EPN82_13080 [Bacteroidota bacterium]
MWIPFVRNFYLESIIDKCFCESLFKLHKCAVILIPYDKYIDLSISLANYTTTYLIWTKLGSPLDVKAEKFIEDELTKEDICFRDLKKITKIRVVIFKNKEEVTSFNVNETHRKINFINLHREGILLFTTVDKICHLLGINNYNQIDFEFGYVLSDPTKDLINGYIFKTGFSTNNNIYDQHVIFVPYNFQIDYNRVKISKELNYILYKDINYQKEIISGLIERLSQLKENNIFVDENNLLNLII